MAISTYVLNDRIVCTKSKLDYKSWQKKNSNINTIPFSKFCCRSFHTPIFTIFPFLQQPINAFLAMKTP